ncbi:lamin tail domain-containing protein [Patescibacteria group bacterium]|nr:lamin tail domain-containing protein [Patescibacteria group bacterium]
MKKLVYAFFCTAMLFAATKSAHAQIPPPVYISEINWAGSELSSADEWIELYNPNGEGVDIGGWILTGAATSGNALSLEVGTTINANDVLLISNYPKDHENTTLLIEPDLVTSSLSLPNSNLDIMLTDPNGLVVDTASTDSSPDFGSTDPRASMQRNLETLEWHSATESVSLSLNQLGSPGEITTQPNINGGTDEESETATEEYDSDEEQEITDAEDDTEVPDDSSEEATNEQTETDNSENNTAEEESGSEEVETENPENETLPEELDEVTDAETVEPADTEESIGNTTELEEDDSVATTENDEVSGDAETSSEESLDEPQQTDTSETITEYDTSSSTPSNNEESPSTEPTRNSYSQGRLLISEIVSDPADGTEWIEIYNAGDELADLNMWSVRDATGKETAFTSASICSNCYVLVENPLGKLNNGGDTVELVDPQSNVIDSVTYGSAEISSPKKGESLALINGVWTVTQIMTPLANNETQDIGLENITQQIYENEKQTESTNTSTHSGNTGNEQTTTQSASTKTSGAISTVHERKGELQTKR